MKIRANRKYYNFTKRQKQRAKSERNERWCKVNKEYAQGRQRRFRAQCRHRLRQLVSGQEVIFPRLLKTNSWDGC